MNWEAGILAAALLYIPVGIIVYMLRTNDQKIDREYQAQLEEIKKKYKV
jgi:hypothetical protein